MKCIDCGRTVDHPTERFSEICPTCWGLRGEFIEARRTGRITADEFYTGQRAIGMRNGTGASEMRRALGLDSPAI